MFKISFYLKLTFFVVFSGLSLASGSETTLNHRLTDLIRPNWPYEAFLAIPRIAEISPTLSIEFSKDDRSIKAYNCVELFYLELQKKFDPEAILERKSLHELLCKAMKRAIEKTSPSLIMESFPEVYDVALSFDFFNGVVKLVEIPYPPLSPLEKLGNLFLDEVGVLSFGDIDLPKELAVEISQTPL